MYHNLTPLRPDHHNFCTNEKPLFQNGGFGGQLKTPGRTFHPVIPHLKNIDKIKQIVMF